MSVLPRGPRNRRSGRRPGWQLLTALLVLAIVASSTLVFTNRVELLRLAVILSLWAAVLAAFVSVIYRRQSETDEARARDMKLVYDLQLDREVSARREYELSVEAQMRRQLARERGQAAEEMIALRAELMSLRSHLEVLLGTDLAPRPALEADRMAMAMPAPPGRVESSRVSPPAEEFVAVEYAAVEYTVTTTAESPIIDVPEELPPPPPPPPAPPPPPPPAPPPPAPPTLPPPLWVAPEYRGSHRRSAPDVAAGPAPAPASEDLRRGRHWTPADEQTPAPGARPVEPASGRHAGGPATSPPPAAPPPAAPVSSDVSQPPAGEDEEPQGQHAAGSSFADLMARLQVNPPASGGGRRRRED